MLLRLVPSPFTLSFASGTASPRTPKSSRWDKDAAKRRAALAELRAMSVTKVFELAIRAGIYNNTGSLA